MARTTAQRYRSLRGRGETWARAYDRAAARAWQDDTLVDPERRAWAYHEAAADIRRYTSQLKIRGASQADRLAASHAADRLEEIMGTGGRSTQTERENRWFREQLRQERRGDDSALFGGSASATAAEGVFYKATEGLWRGRYADRDEAIMEALGVDTLEEAYGIVLGQNQEALEVAAAGGDIAGGTRPGSDIWAMYVRYVTV